MNNREKSIQILAIIILILLSVLLSVPTIHYGYLLEDYKYLRPYSLSETAHTFYAHWEPIGTETRGYRPIHAVQYGFFYLIFGGDPVINHIFQIFLFTIGILFLFALTLRCTNDTTAAFWTSLIYAGLGTMAWQVTHLCNRQHLLLIIFFLLTIIYYDRYLLNRSKISWLISFITFIVALLLKEIAATYPLIIFSFATIIRGKPIRSQLKPLAPYFLILVIFIIIRANVLEDIPKTNLSPPPLDLHPVNVISVYSRALRGTCIQTQGIHDPKNDFPMYDLGLKSLRDYAGLSAFLCLFIAGIILLFRLGSKKTKRSFVFGLSILLFANIIVTAWYRTNLIFISSIGVALMTGIIVSLIFKSFTLPYKLVNMAISLLALLSFLLYFSINIMVFYEIQWAQRPNGFIALTWDKWDYEEYFEHLENLNIRIISGEQMTLFQEKLRQTGRKEWADKLSKSINDKQ